MRERPRRRRSPRYFAYGSNMHVPSMRIRCPRARLLGAASLRDWKFFINAQGYASIRQVRNSTVHGALWAIGPREETALDLYEDISDRLYERISVDVMASDFRHDDVLTYVATDRRPGRPRAGYMRIVHEAAASLGLPKDYRAFLRTYG